MGKQGAFAQNRVLQSAKLDEEVYDVANFYFEKGLAHKIARSDGFQNITLAVIVVNAIYLGVDADNNDADNLFDAHWSFIICENLFCVFFTFEWLVRFAAFKRKFNCLKDNWFKFDSCLVFLMVGETWFQPWVMPLLSSGGGSTAPPTGPLRLLRLLRLSRLVRLMRSFPELVTIIKGMLAATRAVGSSLFMVSVLIYIFAIVMHMFLEGNPDEDLQEFFGTLPRCMWTLLVNGTLLDEVSSVMNAIVHKGEVNTTIAIIFFCIFVLLSAITVMNMLIGILCEVVTQVAAHEKEEAAANIMRQTILLELKKYDDGDGMIVWDEVAELMADPASVIVLESLGIDIDYLLQLQTMSYEIPGAEYSMETLMEQMLMCRRDLPATVKHVIVQQSLTYWALSNKIEQQEKRIQAHIQEVLRGSNRASAKKPLPKAMVSVTSRGTDEGLT